MNTWSQKDIDILKEMFADNYTTDIAKLLNKSFQSTYRIAKKLRLEKSERFKIKFKTESTERILKINNGFLKGNIPHNKGKKTPNHIKIKSSHTYFKKGNKPHNIKYNGHERIDKEGYVLVRIAEGKYIHKHRFLWEQNFGAIPKGMCLVFKDKNKSNITLDNLELITRSENMLRNTIRRFPKELQETIYLNNKIRRVINEKQNRRS